MPDGIGNRHETRVRQIVGFLRDHTDGSIKQRVERLFAWMDIDDGETPKMDFVHVLEIACELMREMDARIDELEKQIGDGDAN